MNPFAQVLDLTSDTVPAIPIDDTGYGVTIPDAHFLFHAEFKRTGSDLTLIGEAAQKLVIPDYFKHEKLPTLFAPDGSALTGDLVEALAGSVAPNQYAQAGTPTPSAPPPIGRVAIVQGNATAVRNGVAVSLNVGDAVYQNDVIQTGSSASAVGVIFGDGTTFHLSANARMVLNEFVYNPAPGSVNSALINLVQGSITFIAGEVARTGDMRVGTPVASLGIRGTAVQVDIDVNNGTTKMSVLVESGNRVGSFNIFSLSGQLIGTVNNANNVTTVTAAGPLQAIAQVTQKSPAELTEAFNAFQQAFQTQQLGQAILAAQPIPPSQQQQQQQQTPPTDPGAPPNATASGGSSTSPVIIGVSQPDVSKPPIVEVKQQSDPQQQQQQQTQILQTQTQPPATPVETQQPLPSPPPPVNQPASFEAASTDKSVSATAGAAGAVHATDDLLFTDNSQQGGDTHTVSASAHANSNNYGTLTVAVTHDTIGAETQGTVTYTYNSSSNGAKALIAALAEGQTHTDTFDVTIVDSAGNVTTTTLSFVLTGVNDIPVLSGFSSSPVHQGESEVFAFTVNDPDAGAVLTITLSAEHGSIDIPAENLPSGFNIEHNEDGTVTLQGSAASLTAAFSSSFEDGGNGGTPLQGSIAYTYTPDPEFTGTDTVTIAVSDEFGATDTEAVDVVVISNLTITASAPGHLIEATNADAGTNGASSTLTLSHATATYDIGALLADGWTQLGGNSNVFSKAGTYGSAALDTLANTLGYQLDNSKADPLNLADAPADSFVVFVKDATQTAACTVNFVVEGHNDAPAFATPDPLSFENGLVAWQTDGTIEVVADGTAGTHAAKLTAGAVDVSVIEVFLELDPGKLAGLNADLPGNIDPTSGSAIKHSFTLHQGETLTFDWKFATDDYEPWRDFAFFSVSNGSDQAIKLSDVFQIGDYGNSGWQTMSYTAPADGVYLLGFGVFNAGDDSNPSYLLIDNIRGGSSDTSATLTYAEAQAPTAIAPLLSLSDVDSATLIGATAKIASNFHSDQDELGFVDQNGISGIYNAATGVLTLTGLASVADYQAALRSVTYFNASDDPSTEQRIITFQASDGSSENHLSDLATATINITLGDNKSPVAHDDSNAVTEEASPNNVGGNVLHNDADADSDTLSVTAVDGTAVDVVDGIVIAGEYGILHVGANGAYDYALDHSKADGLGEDDTDFEVFHYTVTDSLGASDAGTLTIAITGVNDVAVIGGDAEGDVTEDTNVVTPGLLLASGDLSIVDPDAGEAQFVEQPSAVIDGNYGAFTLTSAGHWTYQVFNSFVQQLGASETATDSFTAESLDGQAEQVVSVTIHGVNDAPVLIVPGNGASVNEDNVLSLNGAHVSDVDAGDVITVNLSVAHGTLTGISSLPGGVIVDDGDGSDGTLQFHGSAAVIDALLSNGVSYAPTANYNGSATLFISVHDVADTSDSEQVAITVNSVNDAPSGTNRTISATEDTAYTFTASDFGFSDPVEGHSLQAVKITALATAGTLKLGVFDVTAGQVIAAASIGSLTFQPAANANGTGYTSFTFQVQDNGGTANGGADLDPTPNTFTFNVTAVNDAPVIDLQSTSGVQAAAITAAFGEDGGAVTVAPDLTVSDVDNATLAGASVTLSNPQASDVLSLQGRAGTSGTLTGGIAFVIVGSTVTFSNTASLADYQAALRIVQFNNTSGDPDTTSRQFSFQINDGSALNNVGSATATVTVGTTNNAPVANAGTGSGNEDTLIAIALSGSDIDGTVASFRITSLPVNGTLYSDAAGNNAIALNGTVAASGNAATVYFRPSPDFNGGASFQYAAIDNLGAEDSTPATASITVNGVNDAPVAFDDPLSSVAEDSGTRIISFASLLGNDTAGPANEAGQALTIMAVSNAVGGTAVINGTNIEFTPTANFNGTASFDYTVRDNGQSNGADDFKTDTGSVSFAVTAFNDAPAGTDKTVTVVEGEAYTFSASDFGFTDPNDAPGNVLAAVRISTLPGAGTLFYGGSDLVQEQINADFEVSAADIAAGLLTFEAAANGNGTGYASFTFQVRDDGGGADLDPTPNSITINVGAVNNAPVLANAIPDQLSLEDTLWSYVVPTGTFSDVDNATLTFSATLGNGAVLPAWLSFDANTRTFSGTPPQDFDGQLDLKVTASDGEFAAFDTFTLDITPVNDAPVIDLQSTSGVQAAVTTAAFSEGDGAVTIAPELTVLDVDNATLASASVTLSNPQASDVLSLQGQAGTSGTLTGGIAFVIVGSTVTFSNTASLADYQAALRIVQFNNTSGDPDTTSRQFSFQINDGSALNNVGSATATVTVGTTNNAPVTNAGTGSGNEDTLIAVALSGSDIDGTVASFRITSLPVNGTLYSDAAGNNAIALNGTVAASGAAATVYFQPGLNFNGAASFAYVAIDNLGAEDSTSATASITINAVNDAPVATDESLSSVAEDSGTRIISFASLLGNDTAGPANEAGQALTITAVSNAIGGTAVINGTNIEFTPTANFNGTASFDYTVRDNGQNNGADDFKTDTGSVSFAVTAVNDAPVAGDDPLSSAAEDSGTRIISFASLLGNDTAGPANEAGQALTITAVSNAVGGMAVINGTNIEFTPTANFNGTASFDYTVQDNGQTNGVNDFKTDTGSVSFAVTAVNDAPVATDESLSSVAEDSGTRIISFASLLGDDTAGSANEAGQALTITAVSNVVGGTAVINGTNIEFTPTANFNGTASFDYTVRDNGQTNGVNDFKTDTGSVSFAVTAVNDAPTITLPGNGTATTNQNTPLGLTGIQIADTDLLDVLTATIHVSHGTLMSLGDGTGLTAHSGEGTSSIIFTGSTAAINTAVNAGFTYTPSSNYSGADQLFIDVLDSFGGSSSQHIDITIHASNLIGDANDNNLAGTPANDTIQGLGGNDTLQGLGGDDQLQGGNGQDRAVYTDATGAITVNLAAGTVSGPGVGSDTLTSVEQVQGSNFADTLVATGFGTGSPNAASVLPNGVSAGALFEGMGGNDNISGSNVGVSYQSATAAVNVTFTAPGVGTATGDSSVGTDTFTSGVNFIRGSSFNDTIVGSSAGEQFYGGSGNDLINGGGGVDRARYSAFVDDVTGGVTIDLAVGTVVGDASVGSDTLQSIESIRGSNFADSFNATSFSGLSTNAGSSGTFNEFEGMGGNDTITGNGNTQIAFFNATAAVTVDLVAGTASGDASVGSDTITGGVATIVGTFFGDTFYGFDNAFGVSNNFDGRAGNDTFDGRGGYDVAVYNVDGAVTSGISANMAAGTVTGGAAIGTDTLIAVESVRGTNFADTYTAVGYAGASLDIGQGANFNEFEGMGGNDVITGNGSTRVSFISSGTAVTVNLLTGTATGTEIGTDTITGGVSSVRGSNSGDSLTGSDNAADTTETFDGRRLNDTIDGRGGFDRAVYNLDAGTFSGITVNMAAGTVAGTGGDTTIGNDTLTSVEAIRGTNFIDTYTAVGYAGASLDIGLGANFNEFEGMGGNDVITGNGSTRVSFINSGTSVTVNLLTGTATGTEIGTDTIIGGVSAIRASNSNDTLTGSDNAADTTEAFDGRGGNDSIDGKGGFDRAVYNVDTGTFSGITVNMAAGTVAGTGGDTTIGNDTLISVESIRGTNFADTYSAAGYTGASADIGNGTSFNEFEGMGGNDTITGNGNTRLTFQNATGGVNVNLAAGTATGDASVGSDTFTGVSRVRGSNFSDSITGNNNNNLIEGLAGNDMLTGGIGNDTFRFNADEGADTITDFQQGQDLIRLDGTFASSSDQAFLDFVAQLHSAGNVDTFSVAGTNITLTNVNVSQLQVSDFVIHL